MSRLSGKEACVNEEGLCNPLLAHADETSFAAVKRSSSDPFSHSFLGGR